MRIHKIDRTPSATARAMCIQSLSRPTPRLLFSGWLLAFGTLLLSGCAQFPYPPITGSDQVAETETETEADSQAQNAEEARVQAIPEPQEEPEPDKLFDWNGSGRKISHVVIDTNEQRARFYDGQEQVGWTRIASGVSSHPTPSGEFEVLEKVAKKRSNLYGRIYNAKGGLHKSNAQSSDPIPAGGKFVGARMPNFMRMTYDGIGMHAGPIPRPGQPASHGCIRLPKGVASSLFSKVDIGTRVTVIGNGPDYGNYAERIRRQREQEKLNRIAAAERAAAKSDQERAQERPARRVSQRQASGSSDAPDARSRSRERDQRRAPSEPSSASPSPTGTGAGDAASNASPAAEASQPAARAEPAPATEPATEPAPDPAPAAAPESGAQRPQAESAQVQTATAPTRAPDPTPAQTPGQASDQAPDQAPATAPVPAPTESTTAPEPTPQPATPGRSTAEETAATEIENRAASGAAGEPRGQEDSGSRSETRAPAPQQTAPRRAPRATEPEIRSADREQVTDAEA